jgi:hypothetical protein
VIILGAQDESAGCFSQAEAYRRFMLDMDK